MYWHDSNSKQSNSPSAFEFEEATRLFLLLAVFGTLLALLLLLRGLVTLFLPAFAIRLFGGLAGSTGGGGSGCLGFPVLLRLLLGELVRFPGNMEGLPENMD